jgi:potassium-dependent mechanosensitive channel
MPTLKMINQFNLKALIVILFIFLASASQSQTANLENDTISENSWGNQHADSIKALAEKEYKTSSSNYLDHKTILDQSNQFNALFIEIQTVKNFLKKGFEYKKVMELIDNVRKWKEIAIDGVITNKDHIQTNRNLSATFILLKDMVSRIETWELSINKYHNTLSIYQHKLDSLAKDSILYQVPKDTILINDYYKKLLSLKAKLDPVNVSIKASLDSIQKIELKVTSLKTSLESDIAETVNMRKKYDEDIKFDEAEIIKNTKSKHQNFSEIKQYSLDKAELLIVFYIANHLYKIALMFLLIIGMAFYLRLLARRSKNANIYDKLKERTPVLTNPIASSILITITLFQFFLPLPPFILTSILWVISALALTFILWKFVSRYWFYAGSIYLLLAIISMYHNFILIQSVAEYHLIFLMSIIGIIVGAYFIKSKRRKELNHKIFIVLVIITSVYEIGAAIMNVSGNYNYSKGFMTNGYFVFLVAFMLYWTIILTRDILSISRFFHRVALDDRQQIPMEKINRRLSFYLYLLLATACFILISRITYTYQDIFGPLSEAFKETRTIGKFEFTLQSVFIFFLVIFLSGMISKVISFLTADAESFNKTGSGPGSWLLLVRIAIITAGVLIAFVSAGIPMDRFAVIIGALGVGIGFGMQALVNNLISGLIIAFEKPINVGDIVEISGQVGTMRSIGIRSSVVSTWDGADVIIPNGDLLNQHLINWTMGNTKRRFEIPVSVAYGTDLDLVKNLLLELMLKDDRILKYPEPFVWVTTFNNSSIDFVLKFWVGHFSIGFQMKSDLMVAIDELFKANHIVIPFPQQDVYFHASDELPKVNLENDELKNGI